MKSVFKTISVVVALAVAIPVVAQTTGPKGKINLNQTEEQAKEPPVISNKQIVNGDTTEMETPTYQLKEVPVYFFKNNAERNLYNKYKSRIITVMPYVKIAKQLYIELEEEKANSKKRAYKHYRKDVEKEMRAKFEAELKDLTIGQGEMLFKLINRETGNNAYNIIKEVKGKGFAWIAQIMAKRYKYDLKEQYDPEKEKMIELIIRELGDQYNV